MAATAQSHPAATATPLVGAEPDPGKPHRPAEAIYSGHRQTDYIPLESRGDG